MADRGCLDRRRRLFRNRLPGSEVVRPSRWRGSFQAPTGQAPWLSASLEGMFRRALRIGRFICLANRIIKVLIDLLQLAQIKCSIVCFALLNGVEAFEMCTYLGTVEVDERHGVSELISNPANYCQVIILSFVDDLQRIGQVDLGGKRAQGPISIEEPLFHLTA